MTSGFVRKDFTGLGAPELRSLQRRPGFIAGLFRFPKMEGIVRIAIFAGEKAANAAEIALFFRGCGHICRQTRLAEEGVIHKEMWLTGYLPQNVVAWKKKLLTMVWLEKRKED